MNILYTITSYLPSIGGAQLYLHEIAKRVSREHRVRVVSFFDSNRTDWLLGTTLKTTETDKDYAYEGVSVRRIGFTNKEKCKMFLNVGTFYFNKTENMKSIASFIENKLAQYPEKIDIIHNVRVGREPLTYASYSFARRLNIPFVFTPLHHPRCDNRFYKEYHALYREADALIELTPYEKENYRRLGVNEERIFVTGTGPVLSELAKPQNFKDKYGIKNSFILFIGQGYKYKGLQLLLSAAKILFKNYSNLSFVFIGPHTDYSRKLFLRVKDPRIIHLGSLDLQEKTDALAACDIFCLPSTQESFGAVFLEAWAFGKPVIGIDIPQIRCLIKNGQNGFLTKPDAGLLARSIDALLKDRDLSLKLGMEGRKLGKNFSWDSLSAKTFKAYEYCLSR